MTLQLPWRYRRLLRIVWMLIKGRLKRVVKTKGHVLASWLFKWRMMFVYWKMIVMNQSLMGSIWRRYFFRGRENGKEDSTLG